MTADQSDESLSSPVAVGTYVVCLLDVLGFEHILGQLGLEVLHSKYELLVAHVRKQTGGIDIVPLPDGTTAVGWPEVGNAYFSDSMIFWTRYAGTIGLFSFTQMISDVICHGIEIGLPLRGGIAAGDAILDSSRGVFLGEPLVEVARLERAQAWIGASFGPSFQAERFKCNFYLNTVLPFRSHYKEPDRQLATGIAIDWPRRWREARKSEPDAAIKALDVSPPFSPYYQMSLRFAEFSRQNHDWFNRQSHLDYG
ncbi:MAG: hypothetical protein KGJ49_00055 [Alphaproteobacteria bacterium]|nr:hypothetical protein [Alphaproteobacteria bacterium]